MINQIFAQENRRVFNPNVPAQELKNTYTDQRAHPDGTQIDFTAIKEQLTELRVDVTSWYCNETNLEDMDTFALGPLEGPVRELFWRDMRFRDVFAKLRLPYDKHTDITIPWWNEIAAGERAFSLETLSMDLQPRHSYETQLMRRGFALPIQSASVGGLIMPNDTQAGEIIIGLRGGASFPNTYHIPCGALKITPAMIKGDESVYDVFVREELEKEMGIGPKDVSCATIHSRIVDSVIDKGPMYIFGIQVNMTSAEIKEAWDANRSVDKAEHTDLLSLPRNDISKFISEFYQGVAVDDRERTYAQRQLLHPSALVLSGVANISLETLSELYHAN